MRDASAARSPDVLQTASSKLGICTSPRRGWPVPSGRGLGGAARQEECHGTGVRERERTARRPVFRGDEEGMDDLFDLAEPQPKYKALIEMGGVITPAEGFAVVASRAAVDEVLRDPASLHVAGHRPAGQRAPAHSPQRGPAGAQEVPPDPRPALRPEEDGRDRGGRRLPGEPLHRRIRRPRLVQLHRGTGRALSLCGLPRVDGPARGRSSTRFSASRTGSCAPVGAVWARRGDADPGRDRARRSTPTSMPFSTSVRRHPEDDILTGFLGAEVDGEKLTREEILDICFLFLIAGLDTVTDSLTCFFAYLGQHPEHRQQIVDGPVGHPQGGRGDAALGDAGGRHRPPGHRRQRGHRLPDRGGKHRVRVDRSGQRGPGGVRRRVRSPVRPRGEPPPGLRRRGPPVSRLAPGAPGAPGRPARVAPPHPRVSGSSRASSWSTHPGCAWCRTWSSSGPRPRVDAWPEIRPS